MGRPRSKIQFNKFKMANFIDFTRMRGDLKKKGVPQNHLHRFFFLPTDPFISLTKCPKMWQGSSVYGRDRFISDEEKREYDERVKEEIDQFTSACLDAGECAQPMEAWMKIRERLYLEMVAKRPKTAKVRKFVLTYAEGMIISSNCKANFISCPLYTLSIIKLFSCSSAGHSLLVSSTVNKRYFP